LRAPISATFRQKSGELAAGTQNVPLTISVVGWPNCVAETGGQGNWITAMPLNLERIEWMPSPPLAPDDGPIDSAHLDRMTLGDASLEREVLAMFSGHAVGLIDRLAKSSAAKSSAAKSSETKSQEALALAHTLKGSARAIGAFRVADAAEGLEAAIRHGDDPARALARLKDAVAEARTAIDAILRRS
jgi:HPt (histidine-containing phosphotransfer) domain-containing protein